MPLWKHLVLVAGLWLLYSDSAIVITVWSLTADSTDSSNTFKPKFWPTKHFLNKPDKKQRQSHWGLWPRLHEPLEVNCLMISCTWGTNASFSNNRRTKASVNAMKLGTWRAACTQRTLTGNLGYEGYKTTKGTTSPPSVRILDYSCEYFWRGYDPPLNDSLILLHPMDFTASFLQRRNRWVRIVCKRKLPSRSNS